MKDTRDVQKRNSLKLEAAGTMVWRQLALSPLLPKKVVNTLPALKIEHHRQSHKSDRFSFSSSQALTASASGFS
jgi:hypothetical protein